MDKLILKMILGFAKYQNCYWVDDTLISNIRIKGDSVLFDVSDGHYKESQEIELLELLAWVYSNATI